MARTRRQALARSADARLWLARTLVASQRPQATADFFAQVFSDQANQSRPQLARLHLARADFHVTRGAWDEAAQDASCGRGRRAERAVRARAYYLLGQVEETRGRYADAAAAFAQVARQDPDYELGLAARIGAFQMQAAAGDRDAALRGLTDLAADERNADARADLAVVRARTLAAAGRQDEARDVLRRTLRGQDRDLAAQRGALYYTLADLYRRGYDDYLTAAVYYDSAAAALPAAAATAPRGALTPAPTREAILDAADRKSVFSAFATAQRQLAERDSLMRLGALDDASFARFVQELRERRGREAAAAARVTAAAAEAQAFGGSLREQGLSTRPTSPSLTPPAAAAAGETGFLYYRDPSRVRANRVAFQQVWGNRPLVPNWRRRASITGAGAVQLAASQTLGAGGALDRVGDGNDNLPQVDLSAIPRTPADLARVREQRAEARYALANAYFLRLGQPDSARAWLRRIVDEDSTTAIAPRALYALSEVERSRGDSTAANALLELALSRYPTFDFADRIRQTLGLAPAVAVLDSTAEGQQAYADALAAPDSVAFVRLIDVAARFRGQTSGAQALLAAARTRLLAADGDSLALRAPLPADSALLVRAGLRADSAGVALRLEHLYRALAERYAGTPYAERARGTLAALTGDALPAAPLPGGDPVDDALDRRRRGALPTPRSEPGTPPLPAPRPTPRERLPEPVGGQ